MPISVKTHDAHCQEQTKYNVVNKIDAPSRGTIYHEGSFPEFSQNKSPYIQSITNHMNMSIATVLDLFQFSLPLSLAPVDLCDLLENPHSAVGSRSGFVADSIPRPFLTPAQAIIPPHSSGNLSGSLPTSLHTFAVMWG